MSKSFHSSSSNFCRKLLLDSPTKSESSKVAITNNAMIFIDISIFSFGEWRYIVLFHYFYTDGGNVCPSYV